MQIRAHLPAWAQAPTQKVLDRTPIEGTKSGPLTEATFWESFRQGAGAAELASKDEVPREDNALGKPGVVFRNGLNIYYEGDSSNSRGEFEAVLTSKYRGTEYVTYVHAEGSEFSVLRMTNEDGDVEFKGTQVHRTAQGPDGFFIAGQFSV